ncbi:MAG: mechanosensitive ion channel [Geminicoccaceae bacterium]
MTFRRIRPWFAVLLGALVLWTLAGSAHAQMMPVSPAAPATADTSAIDDIEAVIRTLEDPERRAALLERLRAAQKDEVAPVAKPASDTVAVTVVEDLTTELRRRSASLADILTDAVESTEQLPALYEWVEDQVTDAERRSIWLGVLGALVLTVAVGLAARSMVLRLRPDPDPGRPKGTLFGRFAVEIVAAVVFAGLTLGLLWIGNSVATAYDLSLQKVAGAELSLGGLLFAAMLWGAGVRLLFGEAGIGLHLTSVEDHTATLCRRGLLGIGRLGLVGFGVLYALLTLGLPEPLFTFLVHILYLAVAGIAIVLIVRVREPVAAAILDWNENSHGPLARLVPGGFLARTWSHLAIGLVLLHYLVWALKVPNGIIFLSRATISTFAILVVARLATMGIKRLLPEGASIAGDSEDIPPSVQERADRYAGPVRLLLRGAVGLAATIAILSVWNTGVLDWLTSPTGRDFMALVGTLALIVASTIAAFELTGYLADRFANAKDRSGKPRHSNRSRTLASIFKNVAFFFFGMAGLFTVLRHVGVEPAPLLAGAGVVGLAIGFGSQALVKDLITGLFILLGDTIRVGDVIDIAGKAGVVENMSMRTITLRSYDGSTHTIPYGSIDVVTNMTKEFSFAVMEVGVAYRENTDEVIRVLREIDDRMRKEWPYRRLIMEPLDIAGVDALGDSAVVIRMRSKTRPGEQWGIKREFLRRIKLRFDELGIEIPFPHQTVYFGVGKDGKAPPMFIERARHELAAEDAAAAPPAGDEPAGPVVAEATAATRPSLSIAATEPGQRRRGGN